ncbi:MAG: sodium:proton antiporter [candidate division KSB1 bacterium]|nr:sodium:proton antiporter [candidate division KSB1 bacterium]
MLRRTVLPAAAVASVLFLVGVAIAGEHGSVSHEAYGIGAELPLWSVIPFVGILLSIAIFPLAAPHFWHHHFGKVAAFWALVLAIPFTWAYRGEAVHEILHIYLVDYIPFIILLWSLFTVAGGILIEGTIVGTPAVNTLFLVVGTFLSSWVGTTGSSMLLIRPVLRANASRIRKTHVVIFFIFLVSNIGGSLTPLGDPPLFLGFLHGVPFFWTFRLIAPMGLVAVLLLAIFFALDTYFYRKDRRELAAQGIDIAIVGSTRVRQGTFVGGETLGTPDPVTEPIRLRGAHNFLFLLGILGGVLFSGLVHLEEVNILGVHVPKQNLIRDGFLVLMGLLSLRFTSRELREKNEFTWFPIKEVAYLFAGIFMTIIPALAILRAGEHGHLDFLIRAVKEPWHYFWATGSLSSFLDNAPTYLTFLNTALGQFFAGVPEREAVHALIAQKEVYLMAIASGAVFMGANTYIGNAPNFMVRSIAEENGVRMPSFFGYMAWSIVLLIPSFLLVTLVFFA